MLENKSFLFTEPHASELAQLRIKAREKRRITYDCLNAIVHYYPQDCVKCKMGHRIGRGAEGQKDLLSVLAGRSALVCQNCKDYNADDVEVKIIRNTDFPEKVFD